MHPGPGENPSHERHRTHPEETGRTPRGAPGRMSRRMLAPETAEAERRAVLAARDYGTFRAALAAFDCRACRLGETRTNLVVDRGSPRARVLLVGEGPGAEEDRRGLAFVGRSGKLLDELLREAGLDPGVDVLIANVVKCRPPKNRAPSREEARSCLPYLRRQIDLLSPRWVVLLGATALRHLLPERSRRPLGEIAGSSFREPSLADADILVTFHPAFILRNPRKRGVMVRHLADVATRLRRNGRSGAK